MDRNPQQHEVEVGIANVGFGDSSDRVREDVFALLGTDLVEVRALLKQYDSRGTLALCLTGTLGIRYQGAVYNIPIELYLIPGYPSLAPRLQVVPTANMQLRANHQNVDSSGIFYCDYLTSWHPRSCTLIELCAIASSFFSASPPLFARPTLSEKTRRQEVEEEPPPAYESIPHSDNSAKSILTGKLQERIRSFFEKERKAIDIELMTQARLEYALADLKPNADDSITQFKQATTRIQDKTMQLQNWLEPRIDSEKPKLLCADAVSKQLLEALAESTAIEDLLYALDEFLYEGLIELDVFLREVRRLSNAQFKLKAIIKNIHALLDDIDFNSPSPPPSSHHSRSNSPPPR